ncbi:MAG TPA: DEAD/DEAH box helicase [Verrucomicrobiae bacterium]|nr:DEAD/DEAH box helicase [Verrucomicrobiae bacterium]
MPLDSFHPALRTWFESRLGSPTPAQTQAWPAIRQGKHVLISAPTGSGKTLAAFYAVINDLVVQSRGAPLPDRTFVVYVSPLKALSNDIHVNLNVPLGGIEEELEKSGHAPAGITVAVRTGDTTSRERQRMLKKPPHILVTTPESLYLLLTSESGRRMLGGVKTLIVDEIHAMIGDKRGSHLALSVERMESLAGRPLQRIGLSATQKPLDMVARFLVGNQNIKAPLPNPLPAARGEGRVRGEPDCVIVDTGHRRKLDLRIEVPKSPLTAVMSNEVWGELYERLVELINEHKTTLIFVNTRRWAERLARGLAERIGEEHVSSHHGSMSKEHRHDAEKRLKAGHLKVLVATASMELGIDIGSVELVVQFASPKRIAAFLQRVGRSGHTVGGTPKGILFPLSRDDLVECAALFDSVRRGELDRILMPEKPLDILSQQIVAEVSCQEWKEDDLFQLFRKAYPYRDLQKEEFLELVRMLSEGYTSRRGRRGTYLHYDAVNGRLRGRRGARLVALTNGGSIPDMFDYEVVLQPEGITVGTLNEDFALESLAGDIFTLGSHSWQLIRVEGLKVMVRDAAGKPPTVPFWLGEGASRSAELSESVSRFLETIGKMLDEEPLPSIADTDPAARPPELSLTRHRAVRWLVDEVGISPAAAEQIVIYLWMGKTGLGLMPGQKKIAMERFFDETGDMHLVIHSVFGSRINRAWGLALRKKFCRKFNFELQAAAGENSIILSLSSSHSFPLDEVFHYLHSKTVCDTVIQAMLDSPIFEIRWRWNATRSLAILRNRGGKRVPPQIQRMQAEDLIAQVFPDQIACAENLPREIEVPEHPLVRQVVHDCLNEAMEITALEDLLRKIEGGEVEIIAKDLREPSVFAQEIINARPYAFLDDTEFAERRVNAIRNRGWLDPGEAEDLSRLDPQAVARVKEEAWPEARDADELHDALMIHGFIVEDEGVTSRWKDFFEALIEQGRAARLFARKDHALWIAAERLPMLEAVYKEAPLVPRVKVPGAMIQTYSKEEALREIIRGRLEALGPVTVRQLAEDGALAESGARQALLELENEGFVFRGKFSGGEEEEWCERRLLQRIHRYTIETLRQAIQPVSLQDFTRFLFARHEMEEDTERTGPQVLQEVLEKLEGFEAPAVSWETDLIPSRIAEYDPLWLDALCLSGKIAWSRFHAPKNYGEEGGRSGPVKNTPISLVPRGRMNLWRRLSSGNENGQEKNLSTPGQKVFAHLKAEGASFFEDLVSRTGLLPGHVEEGLAELVSAGLAASDSYAGLRSLLTPEKNKKGKPLLGIEQAGRWSVTHNFPVPDEKTPDYETLEQLAFIYLKRWGVLFRSLMEKESFAMPWRILVRVLRRMELRGEVRGGRFVSQVSGEQFALPETVEELRKTRSRPLNGKLISISAADPLNLLGTILPGRKISRLTHNRIVFRDGIPLAVLESGAVQYLKEFPAAEEWQVHKALLRGKYPPKLKYYLGKH